MSASPFLEVRGLDKVYRGGVHALKEVSFNVERGEFLAVIGLSGSGKSTLLRCLNRLVEPSAGSVRYQGQELVGLSEGELRRRRQRIGMIFQHFNLIKRKTVLANVLSGSLARNSTVASSLGFFPEAEHGKARQCLAVVGLADLAHKRASELSGGQQQRVAIARSLMQDPELLLADEPVASLDPATAHSVMQHLQAAHKRGTTVICCLHFLSLVRQYAGRVLAMKDGRVVFQGDAREIDDNWFRRIYGEDAREVELK